MQSNDIDNLKKSFKMAVIIMQNSINDFIKSEKKYSSASISSEVGETVEDKEIKKLERLWTKEWVCPICGENKGNASIISKLQIVDGKAIEGLESNIHKMQSGQLQPTDIITSQTPRPEFCFDTQVEFDQHMKIVHGIEINEDINSLNDEEILRQYGAHYLDLRYGHTVVSNNSDIKVVPHHHNYDINAQYYKDVIKSPKKTNKERKMDFLEEE